MRRFVTVIALSLSALATPVAAEDLSRTIPINQTDLSDPAAAAALYERITVTAKRLCAMAHTSTYGFPSSAMRDRRACVRESVSRAVGSAASPQLAARHAQVMAGNTPPAPATTLAAR